MILIPKGLSDELILILRNFIEMQGLPETKVYEDELQLTLSSPELTPLSDTEKMFLETLKRRSKDRNSNQVNDTPRDPSRGSKSDEILENNSSQSK